MSLPPKPPGTSSSLSPSRTSGTDGGHVASTVGVPHESRTGTTTHLTRGRLDRCQSSNARRTSRAWTHGVYGGPCVRPGSDASPPAHVVQWPWPDMSASARLRRHREHNCWYWQGRHDLLRVLVFYAPFTVATSKSTNIYCIEQLCLAPEIWRPTGLSLSDLRPWILLWSASCVVRGRRMGWVKGDHHCVHWTVWALGYWAANVSLWSFSPSGQSNTLGPCPLIISMGVNYTIWHFWKHFSQIDLPENIIQIWTL
jgi:hypothetical protein